MRKLLAMTVLLAMAGTAAAADPACKTNYTQEGGFLSGRTFSTWEVMPTVKPADAYKRIHAGGIKAGLRVSLADKEAGALSFEQTSTLRRQPINLPWNIVIEPEGKGSKVTVSKSTPSGYATSEDAQIGSMCAVIDSARK
jgi:hypothetical protein